MRAREPYDRKVRLERLKDQRSDGGLCFHNLFCLSFLAMVRFQSQSVVIVNGTIRLIFDL